MTSGKLDSVLYSLLTNYVKRGPTRDAVEKLIHAREQILVNQIYGMIYDISTIWSLRYSSAAHQASISSEYHDSFWAKIIMARLERAWYAPTKNTKKGTISDVEISSKLAKKPAIYFYSVLQRAVLGKRIPNHKYKRVLFRYASHQIQRPALKLRIL